MITCVHYVGLNMFFSIFVYSCTKPLIAILKACYSKTPLFQGSVIRVRVRITQN